MTTTDGLGRIIQVTEKGILPGSADANTYYTYDGLDNLIGVNQSGQTRSFTYDSLGRMTQAVNGESGTTCYTYDNNGNLSTRLQGANSACSSGTGILTSYNYDYLNRLTSKVMPEGTVTYTYDQGTYGLGRLYSVSYGNATTTYNVHDPLGRVTNHTQTVGGINYAFGYSYNGSNNLTNITYPSGRQEVLTYDTAGRVGQVATNGIANAGSVTYAAHGGIAAFQMGNGLWETTNYNSRLQTSQISLGSCAQTTGPGTPGCSQDQWWLANNYGSTTNNGNLLQQTIGLPGSIQIPEAYSYDKANRLLVASEQSSNPSNPPCPDGSARYVEGFQYDVWGNRTVPCLTGLGSATLAPSFFDSNTNRISAGAGWVYDSAGLGNIVQEPYLNGYRMYLYDSENRQIAFCTQDAGGCVNQDGAGRTRYLYDADGRRVEKRDSTGVTVYVYDIQGNLAAEYSTESAATGSATEYLTADHLGTTRVVTSATAAIVARRDYRPFGEEIVPSGSDPRVGVAGYLTGNNPSDMGTTIKFTGKEREDAVNSSGLDYFGARYFSSAQGRFATPDWSDDPRPVPYADFGNPQTLNLYAYAQNNPVSRRDKDGHVTCDPDTVTWGPDGVTVTAGACHLDAGDYFRLFRAFLQVQQQQNRQLTQTVLNVALAMATPKLPKCGCEANGDQEKEDQQSPGKKKPKLVPNDKHHPNSASPTPQNVQELFDKSIEANNGSRWAKDVDGTIHRFSPPSNGETHWNGSTAGSDPIRWENIPAEIRKVLK